MNFLAIIGCLICTFISDKVQTRGELILDQDQQLRFEKDTAQIRNLVWVYPVIYFGTFFLLYADAVNHPLLYKSLFFLSAVTFTTVAVRKFQIARRLKLPKKYLGHLLTADILMLIGLALLIVLYAKPRFTELGAPSGTTN